LKGGECVHSIEESPRRAGKTHGAADTDGLIASNTKLLQEREELVAQLAVAVECEDQASIPGHWLCGAEELLAKFNKKQADAALKGGER